MAALTWLEGRWQTGNASEGGAEHWTRIGGTLLGVGFTAKGGRTANFELLAIQVEKGVPVYNAMPEGRKQVKFPLSEGGKPSESVVTFSNPQHDFPRSVHYERDGNTLRARAAAPGAAAQEFTWQLAGDGKAADLEQADRTFASDVAARGLDAWIEWFDPEGGQWNGGPMVGHERIRHLMAPMFARKNFRFVWDPVASGMSPAGDLGYTVGRARLTWTTDDGAPAPPDCPVYITIWRKQPDSKWRVLFDAGFAGDCAGAPGA
jgi:ketosteroid isomerase-like protein